MKIVRRIFKDFVDKVRISRSLRPLASRASPHVEDGENGQKFHGGRGGGGNKQYSRRRLVWGQICGMSIGLGTGICAAHWLDAQDSNKAKCRFVPSGDFLPTIHAMSNGLLPRVFNFVADVVEMTEKSVVYIEIRNKQRKDIVSGAPIRTSYGSGFIVQANGLILTNAHVVTNQPDCFPVVKLHDGQVLIGVVEDLDTQSDLATVRIPAQNLKVIQLGSSCDLRHGEWVVALGSPRALANSTTVGIISFTNRDCNDVGCRGKVMEYIQTDAAITFGNSGGPLVNLDGEAIGINSLVITTGISLAIPIDYAKEFLKKAEERRLALQNEVQPLGTARRRYIGFTMLTLTPEIILKLQTWKENPALEVDHGVLVCKVMVDSPAFSVGLKSGDIVTYVNKKPVHSASDIYQALESSQGIILQVMRDDKHLSLTVRREEHD